MSGFHAALRGAPTCAALPGREPDVRAYAATLWPPALGEGCVELWIEMLQAPTWGVLVQTDPIVQRAAMGVLRACVVYRAERTPEGWRDSGRTLPVNRYPGDFAMWRRGLGDDLALFSRVSVLALAEIILERAGLPGLLAAEDVVRPGAGL